MQKQSPNSTKSNPNWFPDWSVSENNKVRWVRRRERRPPKSPSAIDILQSSSVGPIPCRSPCKRRPESPDFWEHWIATGHWDVCHCAFVGCLSEGPSRPVLSIDRPSDADSEPIDRKWANGRNWIVQQTCEINSKRSMWSTFDRQGTSVKLFRKNKGLGLVGDWFYSETIEKTGFKPTMFERIQNSESL